MYSKILVAVDGSDTSTQALKHAIELAKSLSATLRMVHVVDMDWLSLAPELAIDVQSASSGRRHAGEATLAAARATAQAAGLEPEVKLLETSAPAEHVAETLAREAAHWPADMVIVGTHGRRGVERLLLGSVAEGVARRSPVPVLLVPFLPTDKRTAA